VGTLTREETNYIVVHCSATAEDMDIGAKEIDRWHRQKGWRKIGYHFVIRRDGIIETGRDINVAGAHAYGYNGESVSVCLIGGVDDEGRATANYTPEQWAGLRRALTGLSFAYPEAAIVGHRDLSPDSDGDGVVERHEWTKECPCFEVGGFLDQQVGLQLGLN